jgi:hypothetical protein
VLQGEFERDYAIGFTCIQEIYDHVIRICDERFQQICIWISKSQICAMNETE